ncbi:hypothetical protein KFL_003440030 [Klebsormidium nitens]|uniref:Transmembrane protein n=1 Tax=Klebsormidium nitens TaxID=105231 RepID=A0A1Y1IBF5_KLENI|nr:hypothetical protein KFL_003440030 [Klebsormidium nitens]|eukprot:GAQ87302.1 hypothetical protein KFL_003440030 [Klebsormidium nitens]
MTTEGSLSPHEPETLSFGPLVLQASRIFRNHVSTLVSASLTLMALPLLTSFSVVAFSGAQEPGTSPLGPPKLSPALVVLLVFIPLMSAAATVALIAVVVHVVVGDHLGRTAGNVWLAVRRSFWRLAGTLLAKVWVLFLLLTLDLIGGCVIVLLVAAGHPAPYPILYAYILLVFITTPTVVFVSMTLSLADHATAIEGAGIWGFQALRRSWALSKGNWLIIVRMKGLDFATMWTLAGPLDSLALKLRTEQPGLGHGFVFAAYLVGALVLCALVICQRSFFKVAWCLVYLSARKKAEPEFGLSTLLQTFEADSSSPEGYAGLMSTSSEV